MKNKVHTSAIVVIPPPECYPPIQDIRSQYDKSFERWMPHINLIYPFYEEKEFEKEGEKAAEIMRTLRPFSIRFSSFSSFHHSPSSSTVFLSPFQEEREEVAKELKELQGKLQEIFPDCDDLSNRSDHGFVPHLTVGQFKSQKHTKEMIAKFSSNWQPFSFLVEYIYIISRRGSEPFQIRKVIPLGDLDALSAPFPIVPLPVFSENLVKLFISNIDFQVKNSQDLKELLDNTADFTAENVVLLVDRITKRSKGCGFLEVRESQLENALRYSAVLNDRPLRIALSTPKRN